jgi:hypothetical protein
VHQAAGLDGNYSIVRTYGMRLDKPWHKLLSCSGTCGVSAGLQKAPPRPVASGPRHGMHVSNFVLCSTLPRRRAERFRNLGQWQVLRKP